MYISLAVLALINRWSCFILAQMAKQPSVSRKILASVGRAIKDIDVERWKEKGGRKRNPQYRHIYLM